MYPIADMYYSMMTDHLEEHKVVVHLDENLPVDHDNHPDIYVNFQNFFVCVNSAVVHVVSNDFHLCILCL